MVRVVKEALFGCLLRYQIYINVHITDESTNLVAAESLG